MRWDILLYCITMTIIKPLCVLSVFAREKIVSRRAAEHAKEWIVVLYYNHNY
jgi:hypothetical protein